MFAPSRAQIHPLITLPTSTTTTMGRELQKKKNRSSVNKVRQKPKSKKTQVRGNAVVAANW